MYSWLKTGSLQAKRKVTEVSVDAARHVTPEDGGPPVSSGNNTSTSLPVDLPRSNKKPKAGTRQYDKSYLLLGFTSVIDPNGVALPKCVRCWKTKTNESMVPSKLLNHQQKCHPDDVGQKETYFKSLLAKVPSLHAMHTKMNNAADEGLRASYEVSYEIARKGEAYTIGESLIKPCAVIMTRAVIGEESVAKLNNISLSDTTVRSRTHEMARNIEDELVSRVRASPYHALQLDESTDVSGLAVLLVFVRYIHADRVEENMLMCHPLDTHTTALSIFEAMDNYYTGHDIPWAKCIDVCTDGARAMVGVLNGLAALIKKQCPNCTSSHCMLHREALASMHLPPSLKVVMEEVVKLVNYIKTRPLKSRLFSELCEDMGSDHKALLMHANVRWLSRGKVLIRMIELHQPLHVFMSSNEKFALTCRLSDEVWLQRVAYMADIFGKLNTLNRSLQGNSDNILTAAGKIEAFKRKLDMYVGMAESSGVAECFTELTSFLSQHEQPLHPTVLADIKAHLRQLRANFEKYFPKGSRWPSTRS
jgi:hypothetical protein